MDKIDGEAGDNSLSAGTTAVEGETYAISLPVPCGIRAAGDNVEGEESGPGQRRRVWQKR